MKHDPKAARDNHANQLNSNNAAYWKSRGEEGVPSETTTPAPSPEVPPQPSTPNAAKK